jgi:hypothetical protein
MTEMIAHVTVFISSPSDVDAERKVVEKVIFELNKFLLKTYKVQLDVISLDTTIVPGIGSDPQNVINSQVREGLYIGLLGARFGTPTLRAGSGTEDEFDRAYQRFLESTESVRLLFYFKDSLEGGLQDIDLEQLKRVQEFRTRIGNTKGVLHASFSSQDELLDKTKNHIFNLFADQWSVNKWKRQSIESLPTKAAFSDLEDQAAKLDPEVNEEHELGVLDYLVLGTQGFQDALTALEEIGAGAASMSEKLAARTVLLNSAKITPGQLLTAANDSASDLTGLGALIRQQTAVFKSATNIGFDAIEASIEFLIDQEPPDKKQLSEFRDQIRIFDPQLRAGRESIMELRRMMFRTPTFSFKLKRATKQMVSILDDLSATITVSVNRTEQILKRIDEVL